MSEKKGFFGALFGRGGKEEGAEEVNGNEQPVFQKREVMEITPAVVDNARLTLQEILTTMQLSVEAVAKETKNNSINLEIVGSEDLGLVIGKEGSTLGALQMLVSHVLSKKYQKKVYVHIDANAYKAKQEEAIIASAKDAADVAERENVQIVLDPMNAAERRIVHTYLQERTGIETFSRGEGPNRQVVVSPKGFKKDGALVNK